MTSPKNDQFCDPHTPFICKMNNSSFLKKRICKHVTNFKTRSTPFHMDVINVWSLALNNGPIFLSFCFRYILCSFQLRFSFKKAPGNFIDLVRSISWLFVFSFGKVSGILVFARFVEKQIFHFCFVLFFFFFFTLSESLLENNSLILFFNSSFILRNAIFISLFEYEFVSSANNWHCVKSVRIRSYSGPYFPAFWPE